MSAQTTLTTGYRKVQEGVSELAQKVAGSETMASAREKGRALARKVADSEAMAAAREKGREVARKLEKGSRKLEAKAQKRFEELKPEIEKAGQRMEEAMVSFLHWLGLPHLEDLEALDERIDQVAQRVEEVRRLVAREKLEIFHLQTAAGGWELRAEGADEAASTFRTKKEALAAARELVETRGEGCQVLVHKVDGAVQTTLGSEAR